jgi:hypothetical protein
MFALTGTMLSLQFPDELLCMDMDMLKTGILMPSRKEIPCTLKKNKMGNMRQENMLSFRNIKEFALV